MPGLIALAIAMGIGRFAFTPLLPMMQEDAALTVAQGGWLASSNYVGYLVGAILALRMRFSASAVVRLALVLVVLTTAAMALTDSFTGWAVLRFVAGVASAWALVFVSSWGFSRPEIVFTGVGAGIMATGFICLVLMAEHVSSANGWLVLGAVSAIGTGIVWRTFSAPHAGPSASAPATFTWTPQAVRLVACYGCFGFGYIVPATFLPVMAKQALGDPAKFGWSWPIFGLAAAASTLFAGPLRKRYGDRNVWIGAHLVMAVGVALPLMSASLAFVLASALLVGGTFMVATMAGIQEARRVAGSGARTLIAGTTTAFATGQILGPVVVGTFHSIPISLATAVLLLVTSAYFLRRTA
ncbi:hypothetical protein BWI17_05450 [Betaproteobacteria bacterium GR16-43]|nr:hypothetical protein BWI17_05450 [Betaproteobacteria bacterium GR16-43]